MTGFESNYEDAEASELTSCGSIDFTKHLDLWEGFYNKYKNSNESIWTFDSKNHLAFFKW